MADASAKITLQNIDRIREGLLITFSDGTSTVFMPEFLYSVRNDDGNRTLPEEKDAPETR